MLPIDTPDGVTLAAHELGSGRRPTLLCHATGFHGLVWEPVADELGADFDRRALDFRAHGSSTIAPGTSLDWTAFGVDVLAAVRGLGLPHGEILGVGHSLGGAALLLAEQARPGTFAGLWLYEPIAPPPGFFPSTNGGNRLADGAARRRASFPSHAAAVAHYAAKPPLSVLRADALHAYVKHGFVPGEDGSVHLACRPEDEARIFRGGGAHDAFANLPAVACPVTVVCGRDEPGPALFAPAVAAGLPDGHLKRQAALGHFGPLEAPGICAASIRELADRL